MKKIFLRSAFTTKFRFIGNFFGIVFLFIRIAGNHPNIVTFLGYTIISDVFYIVLEWISLNFQDAALTTIRKNFKVYIALLLDVLSAMNYLHELDLVHRDLSPKNILVVLINK